MKPHIEKYLTIDALRLMIDEEQLKDKLIVAAAIDERILQAVVKKKYNYMNDTIADGEIVREYIDKLFVFSVKLSTLTEDDSKDYFDKFISGDLPAEEATKKSDPVQPIQVTPDNGEIVTTYEKWVTPTEIEIGFFKKRLKYIEGATPRKIRIIYYRYLFARNLLILKHAKDDENCYWLKDQHHEIFIHLVIDFSQKPVENITKTRHMLFERKQLKTEITLPMEGVLKTIEVDHDQYLELLRVFELSIAY